MQLSQAEITTFQQTVFAYYDTHGRHELPWRQPDVTGHFDPYKIMISELMLQQTQVGRVIPKYLLFIERFPILQSLAAAPLHDVLTLWSGLGYNRRAKFLWEAARAITRQFDGRVPGTRAELMSLPGIGMSTASAILAYSFNRPEVFIETNIRTVYFHHFFNDQTKIPDSELLPIVARTVPSGQSREWYWALMDYGTNLKQTVGNLSRASAHYTRQSAFAGSRRQIRGQVLRLLAAGALPIGALRREIYDERLSSVLDDLQKEGFIELRGARYRLRA
jgi:A/G-specific adenine glycosylase